MLVSLQWSLLVASLSYHMYQVFYYRYVTFRVIVSALGCNPAEHCGSSQPTTAVLCTHPTVSYPTPTNRKYVGYILGVTTTVVNSQRPTAVPLKGAGKSLIPYCTPLLRVCALSQASCEHDRGSLNLTVIHRASLGWVGFQGVRAFQNCHGSPPARTGVYPRGSIEHVSSTST